MYRAKENNKEILVGRDRFERPPISSKPEVGGESVSN